MRTAHPVRRARSSAQGVTRDAQLERVEVDVAEAEHGRAEPVAAGVALLRDHAVVEQRADDPVHGGGRQVDALGDSPRLIRRAPWSTARMRSARSTDWIIAVHPIIVRTCEALLMLIETCA